MKKKKFFVLTTILSIMGICVYLTPYFIYEHILKEGIKADYLDLTLQRNFLRGRKYQSDQIKDQVRAGEPLWEIFHFADFIVPFPLHNPLFRLVPIIEKRAGRIKLGAKFIDPKDRKTLAFKAKGNKELILPFNKQRLFSIPIFKKYIHSQAKEKIKKDLFTKNLLIFSDDGVGLGGIIVNLWTTSYKELVYNLFIYQMRQDIFPVDTMAIFFYEEKNLGIILLPSEDELYLEEIIYTFSEKGLSSLFIESRKYDLVAKKYRQKIIDRLEYKKSDKEAAKEIYLTYKKLGYHTKIDQEGLSYLYAAWTHDRDRKEYLQEMVRFLERGRKNFVHLLPLYQHILKSEKHQKKSLRVPADDGENPPVLNKKTGDEKRVDDILESAKKSGINTDEQMDSFEVE